VTAPNPAYRKIADEIDLEGAMLGLEPSTVRVRSVPDLDVISIELLGDDGEPITEIVLGAPAAMQLALGITRGVARLWFGIGWEGRS
jgi:hypothetical protein